MTKLTRILALCTLFALSASFAAADPIVNGSLSIAGNDSYTSTGITFNPSTGTVLSGTETLQNYTLGTPVQLTSFNFDAAAIGTMILSATNSLGQVVSFTLTSIPTILADSSTFLNIMGSGTFDETDYASTPGMFTLTSTTTGITSFTFDGTAAVTPEPSSLLLLGTGLIGVGAMLFRKRRNLA